ncbi:hypothetical protein CEXT_103441 [Caerostris extrusa]|uniref:Secreted protein n=1 Tax=Caerostris extrusa TaxID=172846 RepID=A0AAV4YAR4_CAEEX|nr:hypothetical protein CEXT_103441 [Caerostris extrusa]
MSLHMGFVANIFPPALLCTCYGHNQNARHITLMLSASAQRQLTHPGALEVTGEGNVWNRIRDDDFLSCRGTKGERSRGKY